MADTVTKLGWSAVGGLVGVAAASVVRRVLGVGWRAVVGIEPPEHPEHPDVAWSHAIVWTALAAATVGVARLVATRKAVEIWRRANGSLPPGLDEEE